MSDLNRREAIKRVTSAGLAASAGTLLAGTVRAGGNQEPAGQDQPGAAASEKQSAILANNHVPVTIFIRGKRRRRPLTRHQWSVNTRPSGQRPLAARRSRWRSRTARR